MALAGLAAPGAVEPARAYFQQDDGQAERRLNEGRQALEQFNYERAIERFGRVIQTAPKSPQAPAAQLGLAICHIESPQHRNLDQAEKILKELAGQAGAPQQPVAAYYLALAGSHRAGAMLAAAQAKPQEPRLGQEAAEKATAAAELFGKAADALLAKGGAIPENAELPRDAKLGFDARAQQGILLLEAGKAAEALKILNVLDGNSLAMRSPSGPVITYATGWALLATGDAFGAGRVLGPLANSQDPAFGGHVRYLLGRAHHLTGDAAEAAALYEAAMSQQAAAIAAARKAMENRDAFRDKPLELLRLQSLAGQPTPPWQASAAWHLAELRAQEGNYGPAAELLLKLRQLKPPFALETELALRLGYCHLQLKQFGEAMGALAPLADHAQYGDRARFWIARAMLGAADPANAAAVDQARKAAMDHLRQADGLAARLTTDADAPARRMEILTEIGQLQMRANQPEPAAATFRSLLALSPDDLSKQMATVQLADALHQAGQFAQARQISEVFTQQYPASPLLPMARFRLAESAFAMAQAPGAPAADQEAAIRFCRLMIEKHPDFTQASIARHRLGMLAYKAGRFEEAAATLGEIPDADRSGSLATVGWFIADCLLRTLPEDGADALATAKLLQQLAGASKQLEGFTSSNQGHPLGADALLKIFVCQSRIATMVEDPNDKLAAATGARTAAEKLAADYPNQIGYAIGHLERPRAFLLANETQGALERLMRFDKGNPQQTAGQQLPQLSVAPLGILRAAAIHRGQGRPQQAVELLARCRQKHEAALLGDPARKAWVPTIQLEQALSLLEADQAGPGNELMRSIREKFPQSPEAGAAALHMGRAMRDQAMKRVPMIMAMPATNADQMAARQAKLGEYVKEMSGAGQWLSDNAAAAGAAGSLCPPATVQRLIYEAAWTYRALAHAEVHAAADGLRQKSLAAQQEAYNKAQAGQPQASTPRFIAPRVDLKDVADQPSEARMLAGYAALLAGSPASPLAMHARLELAEYHLWRGQHGKVPALLTDFLDQELAPEIAQRGQMILGSAQLAAGGHAAAAQTLGEAVGGPDAGLAARSRMLWGQAALSGADAKAAIERLSPFRTQPALLERADSAPRALVLLAMAHGQIGEHEQARAAAEAAMGRFGAESWGQEARYQFALACQNLKRVDEAINHYRQVNLEADPHLAARTQLQLGLCLLMKKEYAPAAEALLNVANSYAYAELSPVALCEAAGALAGMKQPEKAAALAARLKAQHPQSPWAAEVDKRLAPVK